MTPGEKNVQPQFLWKGVDCPPGWKRVGSIDVADPADVSWALDRDYRIGAIYDGMSHSVAEPCAADIYEDVSAGPYTCIRCLAGTWNDSDICDDCAPSPTPKG